MRVRRAGPDDGPTLRRLRLAALRDAPLAFASTYATEVDRPDEAWATWAAAAATGPDQAVFVTMHDDTFTGLVAGYRTDEAPGVYQLVSMWVDPAHRGHGHGRALADAVIDWAERSGGVTLALWSVADNLAARGLYADLGFEPTGETQPLPHHPHLTEVQLARPLHPPPSSPAALPDGFVEFEPMTAAEFERHLPELVERMAAAADHPDASEAARQVLREVAVLLPQGISTPFEHLCTLQAGLEPTEVGTIWFGSAVVDGTPVTLIRDLALPPGRPGPDLVAATLGELEEWSRANDQWRILVRVSEADAAARARYLRHGFGVVGSAAGYVELEKLLDPIGRS